MKVSYFFVISLATLVAGHTDDEAIVQSEPDDDICLNITLDSPWEEQLPIHNCQYTTHTHPRQEPRSRRTHEEQEKFHYLAIFNIKYDLDFQEEGDKCSTKLQDDWLHGDDGPLPLANYSFNRVWYKRLCSFFSFLECVPVAQVRTKMKNIEEIKPDGPHEHHYHLGGLKDKHNHPRSTKHDVEKPSGEALGDKHGHHDNSKFVQETLKNEKINHFHHEELVKYKDSGRSTTGMVRLDIDGRGPGKGRHKSGPGGARVEASSVRGNVQTVVVPEYPLDGICICSAFDPKYPKRKRPPYGMDFVADAARPKWCVAAPGNLCGRIYMKANTWPGQDFEMSDHVGCAQDYDGVEYECVQWQTKKQQNSRDFQLLTATCETKPLDAHINKEAVAAERAMKKQNAGDRMSRGRWGLVPSFILISLLHH